MPDEKSAINDQLAKRPYFQYDYLTEDDVRHYIMDRTIEDNTLDLDLAFSDEEVSKAMNWAARDYNSIPPLIHKVIPSRLPNDTNIFLDGTIRHLLIGKLHKLSRADIDYSTGGVTTNLVSRRIDRYKELIKFHGDAFTEAAKSYKISLNLSRCFGRVG